MAVVTEEEGIKKPRKWSPGELLNIAAYPASAIIGLSVAHANTEEKSFEKLKDGPLKDIADGIRSDIVKASVRVDGEKKSFIPDVNEEIAEIRRKGRTDLKEAASVLGFKNIFKHYQNLNKLNKQSVHIESLTASGITLGALLMVANSKNIFKEMSGKDQDQDKGNSR